MTVVLVDLRRPASGEDVPTEGSMLWRPTRRRTIGSHITLPDAFAVDLVDGQASVDVAPTGLDWVWTVREMTRQGITRHVQIPALGPVHYSALVDVDPATLDPAAEPEAAWWAVVEALPLPSFAPDPDDPSALIVTLWAWQIAGDDPNALLVTTEETP